MKSKRDRHVPAFRYWLYLRGLPEVTMFPTDAELSDAFVFVDALFAKKCHGAFFWCPVFIPLVITTLGWPWVASVIAVGKEPARFILAFVALSTAVVIIRWIYRRIVVKHLRVELRKLGVPVCLHCGYNLSGLPEPRCPECGAAFEVGG